MKNFTVPKCCNSTYLGMFRIHIDNAFWLNILFQFFNHRKIPDFQLKTKNARRHADLFS